MLIVKYITIALRISIGLKTLRIFIVLSIAYSNCSIDAVCTSNGNPICFATICEYTRSVEIKSLAIVANALIFLSFKQKAKIELSNPPDNAILSDLQSLTAVES